MEPSNINKPNFISQELVSSKQPPADYTVESKHEIRNYKKMEKAIEKINRRIDQQKNSDIFDWQGCTGLLVQGLYESHNVTYFIKQKGKLIGYASMRPPTPRELSSLPDPSSKAECLAFMAIHPRKQRKKMGQTLMKVMRHEAKIREAEYLIVDYHGTEKLKKFYGSFKRGQHIEGNYQTRINPETAKEEKHPVMRAIYTLKKPQ